MRLRWSFKSTEYVARVGERVAVLFPSDTTPAPPNNNDTEEEVAQKSALTSKECHFIQDS